MENFFSQKENRLLGSLVLLMALIALGAYASYTMKQSKYAFTGPTTISVVGEAEVMAVPDIGSFTFSVKGENALAGEARSLAAKKANDIKSFLSGSGVEDKDIKTISYNLNPKYRYEPAVCPMGSYCPQRQVADGYEVTEMVQVKVRAVDRAGDLLSGVSDLGVDYISGLEFTVDDTSVFEAEAREAAIADAKAKTGPLAEALGVKVVRMTGYFEDEGYRPYYGYGGDMAMAAPAKQSVDPELSLGENTIKSRVTLTFEVKQ